jgi:hypothetical protein
MACCVFMAGYSFACPEKEQSKIHSLAAITRQFLRLVLFWY